MRSAISSPFSSWRKWPAPATISAGPAPGMREAMCSAAVVEKIGSESEKRTSAGFSQRSRAGAHLEHLLRVRVVHLGRDVLGEREHSGLRLRCREGRVVALDHFIRELGQTGDPHELSGDDVRPDPAHEVAEAEPLRRRSAAGADPGVEDHEARHSFRVLDRESQADRAAPVLDDDRRLARDRAPRRAARSRRSGSRRSSPRMRVGLSERPKPK